MIFTLPFPPKELNPNVKLHWSKKAKAVKKYRHDCGWISKAVNMNIAEGLIPMHVIFYPPDNRNRDLDNMVAAFKAGSDGMADAWGVNDVRFWPTYEIGAAREDGAVTVEVMQ